MKKKYIKSITIFIIILTISDNIYQYVSNGIYNALYIGSILIIGAIALDALRDK